MNHRIFSQHDQREERNTRFQRWLNCEQVLPGGGTSLPPRTDVAATVTLIRQTLPTSPLLQIDLGDDVTAIDLIRSQLTPEENARVQIDTRPPI